MVAAQAVVDQEMIYGAISTTTKPFDFIASLLGRVLSTIQGLMQHKYRLSWRYTLPVIGRLFLHLKEASYPVLARTLKASKNVTHGLSKCMMPYFLFRAGTGSTTN